MLLGLKENVAFGTWLVQFVHRSLHKERGPLPERNNRAGGPLGSFILLKDDFRFSLCLLSGSAAQLFTVIFVVAYIIPR